MDYPIDIECESLMEGVKAKTFCTSFDEQLDIAEQLYVIRSDSISRKKTLKKY